MLNLLEITEAASQAKISKHTLRAWIYQGRLPYVKLGRRVLVRSEDLEEFVNRNLIQAKGKE